MHEFFQQNESRSASPSPIHSPFLLNSPSPINSPLRVHSPINDDWIHEFQAKSRISSPLVTSTYEEFEEIYNSPAQQWSNEFGHQKLSSETSEEEQLAFDRAFEEIQRETATFHHIPVEDWTRAFQEYESYEYTPNNPYLHQPEFIHQAIDTTLTDTVMALEAKTQLNPGDAHTWHQLGIKQQENERDSAAIAALEKAVSIDPTCLDAWLALSISYTNDYRRTDAYKSLEQWIAQHPKYKHIHRKEKAIVDMFLEAARASPGKEEMDPDVQVALGVLLNMSQEYEKAIDCFKSALMSRPDDYRLWNKMGATLQKAGDSIGAVEMYTHALQINPLYIRGRYNLAVSFMSLGQYNDAAESFLTALELQKTTVDVPNDTNENIWNSLRLLMFM